MAVYDSKHCNLEQITFETLLLSKVHFGKNVVFPKIHAAVRLVLADGSVYPETGTLQFTDVSVNEHTGMVTLRAIFPNPKQELLPGMFVRGIVDAGMDKAALLLPQPALVRDAAGNAATYVVTSEDTIEVRHIRVGRTHGSDWIVLDGLTAGERVVVGGIQNIKAGTAVRIFEAEPSALLAAPLAAPSAAPLAAANHS